MQIRHLLCSSVCDDIPSLTKWYYQASLSKHGIKNCCIVKLSKTTDVQKLFEVVVFKVVMPCGDEAEY